LDNKHTLVIMKKELQTPTKQCSTLNALTSSESALVLASLDGDESPKGTAVFDTSEMLAKLSGGRTSQEYRADQSIFSQGDVADAVFYIQSGKVKLSVVSKDGKEAVVALVPEGDFFGEGCLAGHPYRMSGASADEKSTIVRVEKHAMVALLHQESEFAEHFLAYLLSQSVRIEADLVDHLFTSSEIRLAKVLLLSANFGQESKPIPIIANVSQEILAELIGATCPQVSRFLNRFRELGFIEYTDGGMHVHSSLVSVVLHD
jgi:CRP-like cAMP-binding protein